jgi:hypothetical protein
MNRLIATDRNLVNIKIKHFFHDRNYVEARFLHRFALGHS